MCLDCCKRKPVHAPTKHVSISHGPRASLAVQHSQPSRSIPSVVSQAIASQHQSQEPGGRLYLSPSHRALLEQAKASSKSSSPHPTVDRDLHINVKPMRDPDSQEKQADFDRKVNGVAQDLIV